MHSSRSTQPYYNSGTAACSAHTGRWRGSANVSPPVSLLDGRVLHIVERMTPGTRYELFTHTWRIVYIYICIISHVHTKIYDSCHVPSLDYTRYDTRGTYNRQVYYCQSKLCFIILLWSYSIVMQQTEFVVCCTTYHRQNVRLSWIWTTRDTYEYCWLRAASQIRT